MATVSGTLTLTNEGLAIGQWASLGNGDDGSWAAMGRYADKSVGVYGTFGAGGTVVIEGSWDGGTTATVLNDPQGTAVSLQTGQAATVLLAENPPLIRPRVSAGDGTTSLTVEISAAAAT